jgi:hypothetical protein
MSLLEPATLPLKTLTELCSTIAVGVLLDTFVVRSRADGRGPERPATLADGRPQDRST